MKKTTSVRKVLIAALATVALILITVSVNAQSADKKTPAERAKRMTERMKTELSLTDEQFPQVEAVNLKYAQKNEDILKSSKGNLAKYRSIKSSQGEKKKEMKKILDKEQFKKYEDMLEEMESEAKERYKKQ